MYSIFTIANLISFFRMFAGIPLIYCLQKMDINNQYFYYSLYIVIFIIVSDVLDGYLARKTKTVTSLGKIIDPVADKICLMFVLIYLIDIYNTPFLIFFILLSIRDVILIAFTVYLILYKDIVSQANNWGKFFIFITMLMIVFHLFEINTYLQGVFYWLSIILLLISMFVYIKEHSKKIY